MPSPSFPYRSTEERAAKKPSTHPSGIPPALILYAGSAPSAQRHGYATCYQTHLPAARALPASVVAPFRGDARVALANARFGMDNVCRDPDAIARHLPELPLVQVMSVADVARALIYGRTVTSAKTANSGEMLKRLASIAEVRAEMLVVGASLVRQGVIPADQGVTPGDKQGMPGIARDAVRLHRMFTANADAVRGRHPFSAEAIARIGADGEWLLEAMKPRTARTRTTARAGSASDDCNRLGVLLVQRHAMLRKIAYYLHGDAFDAVVPPLLSATRAASVVDEEPADPPAPPAPPAP